MKLNYMVTIPGNVTDDEYARGCEYLTERSKRRYGKYVSSTFMLYGTFRKALGIMQHAKTLGIPLEVECRNRRNKYGQVKVYGLR